MSFKMKILALTVLATSLAGSAYAQGSLCPPGAICHYYQSNSAPTGVSVIVVDAKTPWTATGIQITPGELYTIIAKGQASTAPGLFTGPEGWGGATNPNHPVPTASVWSLIGRIGTTNDPTPGNNPFYVGSAMTLEPQTASGELYLGFNDTVFSDNAGSWVVYVIESIACPSLGVEPTPTPLSLMRVFPNPTLGASEIHVSLEEPTNYIVEPIDATGRLVRIVDEGFGAPGDNSFRWDGVDSMGRPVASGTYFLRLTTKDHSETARVTVIR